MVIWYDILNQVDRVSKVLQKLDIGLLAAVAIVSGLLAYMMDFQDTGFEFAKITPTEIAREIHIEPWSRASRPSKMAELSD